MPMKRMQIKAKKFLRSCVRGKSFVELLAFGKGKATLRKSSTKALQRLELTSAPQQSKGVLVHPCKARPCFALAVLIGQARGGW